MTPGLYHWCCCPSRTEEEGVYLLSSGRVVRILDTWDSQLEYDQATVDYPQVIYYVTSSMDEHGRLIFGVTSYVDPDVHTWYAGMSYPNAQWGTSLEAMTTYPNVGATDVSESVAAGATDYHEYVCVPTTRDPYENNRYACIYDQTRLLKTIDLWDAGLTGFDYMPFAFTTGDYVHYFFPSYKLGTADGVIAHIWGSGDTWYVEDATTASGGPLWPTGAGWPTDALTRFAVTDSGAIYFVRSYDYTGSDRGIWTMKWEGGSWSTSVDYSLNANTSNYGVVAYRRPGQPTSISDADYPVLIYEDDLYTPSGGGGWTYHAAWSSHGLTPASGERVSVAFDHTGRVIVHGFDGIDPQTKRLNGSTWESYQATTYGAPAIGYLYAW